MNAPDDMTRVIEGKRYSTATATLLAHDNYWDGSNWTRNGRNTFLYRTPRRAFFTVNLTQWQGERNTLLPVSVDDAQAIFEAMPEQCTTWEDAFNVPVTEA